LVVGFPKPIELLNRKHLMHCTYKATSPKLKENKHYFRKSQSSKPSFPKLIKRMHEEGDEWITRKTSLNLLTNIALAPKEIVKLPPTRLKKLLNCYPPY